MRIRDWHILTNGLVRFTTDDRFNVLYKEGSFNWILQVHNNPPTPHIKAGHSWPIFRGDKRKGKWKYYTEPSVFFLFLAPLSRNRPKCSRCWKCGRCARTPFLPTIRLSLSHTFPYFSHSFMSFIFFRTGADSSPYYVRVSFQQRWHKLHPR